MSLESQDDSQGSRVASTTGLNSDEKTNTKNAHKKSSTLKHKKMHTKIQKSANGAQQNAKKKKHKKFQKMIHTLSMYI